MLKLKFALLSLSSLFFLSTSVSAAELACPNDAVPMEVRYGDIVDCSIESTGDLDVYAIALNRGDFINIQATYTGSDNECTSLNLLLRALNDENKQLARSILGLSTRCAGSRIEFIADKTGTHTITIADQSSIQTGEYKIEFQCISGSCISQTLLSKQECAATFDGSVFEVPFIEVNQKIFFANFKLIPGSSPFKFELTVADEK